MAAAPMVHAYGSGSGRCNNSPTKPAWPFRFATIRRALPSGTRSSIACSASSPRTGAPCLSSASPLRAARVGWPRPQRDSTSAGVARPRRRKREIDSLACQSGTERLYLRRSVGGNFATAGIRVGDRGANGPQLFGEPKHRAEGMATASPIYILDYRVALERQPEERHERQLR